MNKMKIILLLAGFASVMLTSLPAGAWFFAGARGVMVVLLPPPCYGLCSSPARQSM